MKERIKKIMEEEDMTPARFADSLDIGRAVISHILNGRNNPSLEVITRILTNMPQINSDWLLTGNGQMYRNKDNDNLSHSYNGKDYNDSNHETKSVFPDLFTQIPAETSVNTHNHPEKNEYAKQEEENSSSNTIQNAVNEKIIYKDKPSRKIRQIIVYYDDNTFETFISG